MTPLYQKVQNKPRRARNSPYHQGDGRQNILGRPPFWAATDWCVCGARASIHAPRPSLVQGSALASCHFVRVEGKCPPAPSRPSYAPPRLGAAPVPEKPSGPD